MFIVYCDIILLIYTSVYYLIILLAYDNILPACTLYIILYTTIKYYDRYLESEYNKRSNLQNEVYDKNRRQFMCPLCKKLCNSIIPCIPTRMGLLGSSDPEVVMGMIARSSVERAVTWQLEPRVLPTTAKPTLSTATTNADKVSSLGEAKQTEASSSTPLSEPSLTHEVPALEHLVSTAETLLSDAAQGTARLLGPPPPSDVEGKKGSNRYTHIHTPYYCYYIVAYVCFYRVAYTGIHMHI